MYEGRNVALGQPVRALQLVREKEQAMTRVSDEDLERLVNGVYLPRQKAEAFRSELLALRKVAADAAEFVASQGIADSERAYMSLVQSLSEVKP